MDDKEAKEEKKELKKLNKISLPRKILVLKNVDKSDHERWDDAHKKNIANFPAPMRCVVVGPNNMGKTNLVKNLLLNARPLYDNVFLIHPDVDYSKEWEDIEPTDCMTSIPPISYFSDVIDKDDKKKNVCVIDDVEFSAQNRQELKNLGLLMRYLSTHRNMSIIFSHQSWFDIPTIVRKMSNVFIIYKPRATNELSMIENRCGAPSGLFEHIFENYATGYRDNICYDLTENTPAKIRVNLFDVLEMDPKKNNYNKELNSSSDECEEIQYNKNLNDYPEEEEYENPFFKHL